MRNPRERTRICKAVEVRSIEKLFCVHCKKKKPTKKFRKIQRKNKIEKEYSSYCIDCEKELSPFFAKKTKMNKIYKRSVYKRKKTMAKSKLEDNIKKYEEMFKLLDF